MTKPRTKKAKSKVKKLRESRYSNVLVFGVLFAVIASTILISTRAAGPFASIEPENSAVNSPASIVNDSTASGGKYVQFKQGGGSASVFGVASGVPFDLNSAFNKPIAANPSIDINSAAIVANLATQAGVANIYNWGSPVYNAYANTPRYTFKDSGLTESWCAGQMNNVAGIPIPTGATPSPGSGSSYDGAIVVIDWAQNPAHIYEFYRFQQTAPAGGTISAGCAIKRTSYLGEGNDSDVSKFAGSAGSITTGSKISRLAGVVRSWEIEALGSGAKQHLDHALVFSTNKCKGSGGTGPFRYPALKSDGKAGFGNEMIEEGARIQLDPTFNVSSISNVVERGIARTLQIHGAIAMDCGGANMAFIFDAGLLEPGDPYKTYNFGGSETAFDYRMNAIPWNRLRVISKQLKTDFYP